MPTLAQGRPFESDQPSVVVENALAIGRHRFALTVVDDLGNESAADELELEVRRRLIVGPPVPGVLPPIADPTPVPLRPRRRNPR
jgi:hypothetical protein